MLFQNIGLILCVVSFSTLSSSVAEQFKSTRKLGYYDWTCGPVVYDGTLGAPMTITSSMNHCLDASLTKNWDFWELDVVEGVSYSIDFQKINCNMDPVIYLYEVNPTSDLQCILNPYNSYAGKDIKGLDYVTRGTDDDSIPSNCPGDEGQHISFTPSSTGKYALTVRNELYFENVTCSESYDYEISFDFAPRCVSINGRITEQYGDPTHVTCSSWDASSSDGCNNVAVAEGKHATAIAGTKPDDKCLSVNAKGHYAYASASGTYQVASTEGSRTKAIIHDGSQNTAVARGPHNVFHSNAPSPFPPSRSGIQPDASIEVTGALNNVQADESVAEVNGTGNTVILSEGHEAVINGDYNLGEGNGRIVASCSKGGCLYTGSFSITGNSNIVRTPEGGVVSVTGHSNHGSSILGCTVRIDGEYNTGKCELKYPSAINIQGTWNNVNVTGDIEGFRKGMAKVTGNENTVTCVGGAYTQAEATGDRNYVSAVESTNAKVIGGNANTVKSESRGSSSIVENGDSNYLFTTQEWSKAKVINGNRNTAGAEAENAQVSIEDGNDNSVTHNVADCIQSISGVSGQIITGCP